MSIYAFVLGVDLLMPFTIISMWWSVHRARSEGPNGWWLALPFLLGLIWGAVWSYYPPLSAYRFMPAPRGQGGAILALIAGLILLLFIPNVRKMFRSINQARLVDIGVWRVVYGIALLLIGIGGGLPSAFFWSAAFGDIFVGLWALTIIQRRPAVSHRELIFWNSAGLVDLVHVLALGALNLPMFYNMNPEIPPLNLLPLVGVPFLLVLHIYSLMGLVRPTNLTTIN